MASDGGSLAAPRAFGDATDAASLMEVAGAFHFSMHARHETRWAPAGLAATRHRVRAVHCARRLRRRRRRRFLVVSPDDRSGVVAIRSRCATCRARRHRHASTRPHRLANAGRHGAAVHRQRLVVDSLRHATHHREQHRAGSGEDRRCRRLSRGSASRRERSTALVRRQRLHPPRARLDAELQFVADERQPRLPSRRGRQGLLPRWRRCCCRCAADSRLLWRERCTRRRPRSTTQLSSSTRR